MILTSDIVKLLASRCPPALTLQDWTDRYGALFSFRLGSKLFIVISDHQVATDILVSRALWTSSRLELPISSQALWANLGVISTTDNEIWRNSRRVMQQLLTSKAIAGYLPVIRRRVDHLLVLLCSRARSIEEIEQVLDMYVVELAFDLLLGTEHCHREEAAEILPVIKQVERSMRHLEYSITEVVPYLVSLPSRRKSHAHRLRLQMIDRFRDILRRADPYNARLVSLGAQGGLDETEVALLAAAFVIEAHVSTVPILHLCIEALSTRPDILHRARADVDSIVGELVKPDLDHEVSLPFISGIIKESLRCQAPFVHMPHVVSECFTYREMRIPQGAAIILNAWPINNHARDFVDPLEFEPIRYSILDTGDRQRDVIDRHFWAFGSGHRVCPAVLLSHRILWLTITRMIWAVHIKRVPGSPQQRTDDQIDIRFRFPSDLRRSLCSSVSDQSSESSGRSVSSITPPPDNERWIVRIDDSRPRDSHAIVQRIRDV